MTPEEVRERVLAGGLLPAPGPLVVMLSGGRDSVCLLDLAVTLCPPGSVYALHVNYRLRQEADEDERHCRELCVRLGVDLDVARPDGHEPGDGNVQAWAREVRYREANRIADAIAADLPRPTIAEALGSGSEVLGRGAAAEVTIATGHTASDQVETILYRLAASPGRRALLGMAERDGRLVRPLLEITREETADYCRARSLSWREDRSNEDERYARARVRNRVVPALRAVHPAAEANVLRTAALLRAEAELLDGLVEAELGAAGEPGAGAADVGEPGAAEGPDGEAGPRSIAIERLQALPGALQRLIVVRLAEDAAGTFVPQAGARVEEILALARRGGRAELHVGGLVGAVVEGGRLRMIRLPPRA